MVTDETTDLVSLSKSLEDSKENMPPTKPLPVQDHLKVSMNKTNRFQIKPDVRMFHKTLDNITNHLNDNGTKQTDRAKGKDWEARRHVTDNNKAIARVNNESTQPGESTLCHQCGKSYSDYEHLKSHIRFVHNKKYSCHICFRPFSKPQLLASHISVHTGHRLLKCSTCGKEYASKGTLRKHEYLHTGGEGPLICEFCELRFPSSDSLKYHVKDKHKIKDSKCELCGKTFFSKGSLKEHMMSHIYERPQM